MKLIVICGAMFSGKSTRLITEGEKYAKAGRKVVYLKPASDTRYSINEIVTHDGVKVPASIITDGIEKLELVQEADVVLIDEVQFIPISLINEVKSLLYVGKTVIVAGLDMDYMTNSFPVVRELMCQADEVYKLKGICKCGAESVLSSINKEHRKDMLNPVVLGANDKYQALCRKCFYEENFK